jgi:hypothetical protein
MYGTDRSIARQLAHQRAGRQRDGETDEQYAARIEDAMPRANPVPVSTSTEARTARIEAAQRRGVTKASA